MVIDVYSVVGGLCVGWVVAKSSSMLNLYLRDSNLRKEWSKDIELAFAKRIPVIMNQQNPQNPLQPQIPQVDMNGNDQTKPTYVG